MATITTRWLISLTVALVAVAAKGWGQSALHWSSFKTADGLSEPVLDAISFTHQGKLIATHANTLSATELDGYVATNFSAPSGNLGRIRESPGGQRWALVSEGLMQFKNDTWLMHPITEIKAAYQPGARYSGGAPVFIPIRQGCVLFLLPDGLREFFAENPNEDRTISICTSVQRQIGAFTGMAISHDESLWISGIHGLARAPGPVRNLEPDTTWQEFSPPESLQFSNLCQPMPDHAGGVTLVADSTVSQQKVVVTFDGHKWTTLPAGPRNFFCAWRGPDQAVYAVTPSAFFEWGTTNWIEHDEISMGQIFDVDLEPGGACWLATSDGLLRGALPPWYKPEPVRELDSPVDAAIMDADSRLCFAGGNKLNVLQNGLNQEYPMPPAMQNVPAATCLFPLKDGSVLAGRGNVLFEFRPRDDSFGLLPVATPAQPVKPLGLLPDGSVCLYHNVETPFYDGFDGSQFHPLANPPPIRTEEGAPATLFSARDGDLWLGGDRAVLWCHEGQWKRFISDDHTTPETVVGFVQRPDGKIWCATASGLWEFDGKNWSRFQTKFNHINAIIQSRLGEVWVASNGGLFRFCGGIWMENDESEGLPNGAVNTLCEDQLGHVWAANAHGLNVFHAEADASPPKTFVRWLGARSHRLSEGDTLNLLFDGMDKWKMTPRERLLYSYQLDQQGWSVFQDLTMFTFPDAVPGRHYFQVRAMDRSGNIDPISATLDFTVAIPWFRELRLWIILLLGLAAAVFFAGIALNRHRQLIRSHAAVEQKVAERTRELEIATRELMHSQKMNALGTLAAGIAHDFNNILSIIKGSAQIIEDNTDQPEKIRTRVSRIKTVVQQGAEIVDAMLGFGRAPDAGAPPCDVNAVVSDTIKLLGDRFLREVEVKFERAERLPEISKSREFIQQILLNFIFNAAEAMSLHKKITVTTHPAEKPPADIYLLPAPATSFVLVSVQDQGGGIAPEIRSRIFEPFFTTKAMSTKRGTGLGLSMVYELAKKMGAGLAVQSTVGEGSTFTLILPVPDEPAMASRTKIPLEPLSK